MIGYFPPFVPQWRFGLLVLCHVAALLLWASLEFEPAASVWREVDRAAFLGMNGILGLGEGMQVAWAYMNTKMYDNINGAIMVLFGLWVFLRDRARPPVGRMALFAVLSAAILMGVVISKEIFVDMDKLSPSLALASEPYYNLAELVPHIKAKTGSTQSFPADHGVVTFIYVGFFLFVAARRHFWLAVVLGFFNAMPRMVVGAHWLSDTLVGGGMFALVVLAWALATPALVWAETIIGWVFRRAGLGRFL